MRDKQSNIDRRNFLNTVSAGTVGSLLVASNATGEKGSDAESDSLASSATPMPQLPRRKLGRTGEKIPVVGLGCVFDMTKLHNVLGRSLEFGMSYWDTATNYGRRKSQIGIGQYLEKHPEVRGNVFLISKPVDLVTPLPVIADLNEDLHGSFERAKTDHFDAYCPIHGFSNPEQLTDELKAWSEDCKKRGLFKYVGYSAHENMAEGLRAAAKAGWIDFALVAYNIQLMQDDDYQRAIDAAYKAGIGLIAIKTQRKTTIEPMPIEAEADRRLAQHFLEQGYSEGQAKLKIVLEDERFAAAAVGQDDIGILTANVAAALDQTKLASADCAALSEYAKATCDLYCEGCSHICHGAVPHVPYIHRLMRCAMYHDSYGHHDRARDLLASIPEDILEKLSQTNFRSAEARCPRNLPIGQIIRDTVSKLA